MWRGVSWICWFRSKNWRRGEAQWKKPVASFGRGYGALYLERVTQANLGCDFDFLGEHLAAAEPEIH